MKRLLVIDDDPDICAFVVHAAQSSGYQAAFSTDFESFKERLTADTAVVVVDLMMPDVDGIQVLRYLSTSQCSSEIVLISGYDKKVLKVAAELAKALQLNVRASIQKPLKLNALRQVLGANGGGRKDKTPAAMGGESPSEQIDLQRAITENQLLVHYQPQYHIKTNDLAGVEALVRWRHPTRGLLPASAFIEAFEGSGLVDELTWIVARKIVSDTKKRFSAGARVGISMNVSALSLRDLSFPDRLVAIIVENGGQPSDFVVEVTESGLVKELHTALDILARMRLKGLQLSIDDFGTGYAMMQQLQRVPARELKLDMAFVQSMLTDDTADSIVRRTLELAHDLDMFVVAEGVETADQLRALSEYGCDMAQGYFFGRPGPAEALRIA